MNKGSGFALLPIFVIMFLSCAAAAPVSPPESRFVWEPGENLTFTWTHDNFYGFYYDAEKRAGKESLTINLDNIKDRSIPENGIVYSTKVETVTARYAPFGEYAVIGLGGDKYLAGFPEGKSNITLKRGINLNLLQYIMKDDDGSYTLVKGGSLFLSGYVLKVQDVDAAGSQVTLSLSWEGSEVDTDTINAGKNYVYEISDGRIIAAHIDSVFEEKGTAYVIIKGIFQVSYEFPVLEYLSGVVKRTNVSRSSIAMRNAYSVDLKPGSIVELINGISLKTADSDTLRIQLYGGGMYGNIERGATGSNNMTAWDGLNYRGFWYDVDSGNYSESLVITNMTGRRIPESSLTYTSYIMREPYAVTKVKGFNIPGTDGSYILLRLGGKKYMVKNSGFAELLIAHGDGISGRKILTGRPPWFEEGDESGLPMLWEPGMDTWEMGEGFALTVKSIDTTSNPRKARLVLRRNGVELDDVWLSDGNAYRYFQPGENGTPKLITYLDAVFAGATVDAIQLRYTWFVSDNVTYIKEGDRFGVFNVMVVEPDLMVLKNRVPIELKAGSSINLFGNLSFFVENSDELRFYPTNMAGTQVMAEEVTENAVLETPDLTTPTGTSPVAGRTEKTSGFEAVLSITIILAAYIAGRKMK